MDSQKYIVIFTCIPCFKVSMIYYDAEIIQPSGIVVSPVVMLESVPNKAL